MYTHKTGFMLRDFCNKGVRIICPHRHVCQHRYIFISQTGSTKPIQPFLCKINTLYIAERFREFQSGGSPKGYMKKNIAKI